MSRPLLVVLMPSLRISGGNKEVVRLIQELLATGQMDAVIACMWKHPHEVDTGSIRVVHLLDAEPVKGSALVQLPRVAIAFRRLVAQLRQEARGKLHLVLGHYSTYVLAWLHPWVPRVCFNQDMEWLFVPDGWRRFLLRKAILLTNRRSVVVTTNAFVSATYRSAGVQPFGEASIWAEEQWLAGRLPERRDIDVLMLLRGSGIKRLDLYQEALRLLGTHTGLRLAVITPDTSIAEGVVVSLADVYLRPTDQEMQELFARSRTFLLLSDVEGFGLPPLEGMGSGCVPVCRDSGGVRCYMQGEFARLLFPLERPVHDLVSELVQRLQTGSLPSPARAQEMFRAGLQASRVSRNDCIQRLRTLLCEA